MKTGSPDSDSIAMLDAEECERARVRRDRRYDGRLFSGVRTTGIYCRPVCPVRPAQGKNVTFYATAAAAQGGASPGQGGDAPPRRRGGPPPPGAASMPCSPKSIGARRATSVACASSRYDAKEKGPACAGPSQQLWRRLLLAGRRRLAVL